MRGLAWLIGLPLIAVAAVFSVANRHPVRLDLWPLPFEVEIAAFAAVLVPLAFGLAFGALLVWLSGTVAFLRARRDRRRLGRLERQLAAAAAPPSQPSQD